MDPKDNKKASNPAGGNPPVQQGGGTPPAQQRGYQPPPQQGGFYPPQGGFPPAQQGGYQPPAQQRGYQPPPQQGGYYPPQGGFPPAQQGGYQPPPQGGGFPPAQQGGYQPPPQQGGGFPPAQQGRYQPPPGGGVYPPVPPGAPGAVPEDTTPANFQLGTKLPKELTVKIPKHSLKFDGNYFLRLLASSISLSKDEKKKIIDSIPKLKQGQIDELIRIFEEEKQKFAALSKKHVPQLEKLANQHYQEWMDLESDVVLTSKKQEDSNKAEEIRKKLGM